MRTLVAFLFFTFAYHTALAQGTAVVHGKVTDEGGIPLTGANVFIEGTSTGVACEADGGYVLRVPAEKDITLRYSYTGMEVQTRSFVLIPSDSLELNVKLKIKTLGVVNIEVQQERELGLSKIDPKLAPFMSTPQGGIEALLVGQLGYVSRNELSSGYSVRGGNFDENLVYVNGIEVYRPFLVRAGQQEGLSFPNPDMTESIKFSAGGFEARYGDKMSSVLDVTYKRPKEFHGTAMAGLLGGSFSLESTMANKRLRQITGFRYRTNQILLQGLDTKAEYRSALHRPTDLLDLCRSRTTWSSASSASTPATATTKCRRAARPNSATSTRPCASRCSSTDRSAPSSRPGAARWT